MYKYFYFLQVDTTGSAIANNSATIYTISYILIGLAALILLITIVYYFRSRIKRKQDSTLPQVEDDELPETILKKEANLQATIPQIKNLPNEVIVTREQEDKTGAPLQIEEIIKPSQRNEQAEQKERTKPEVKKKDTPEDIKPIVEKTKSTPPPPPIKVQPEKEEQSTSKFIGYNPLNIFEQSEPLQFPYVIMPNAGSVIKFPRKGRKGRKGYKEEDFRKYIVRYFQSSFQVFDDRFILVKGSDKPFEPDISLIDEKKGINLFIDIEIDEPYEGINDISKRKATHYQLIDANRNSAFKSRGWIVIRFAEIQVHQQPESCCLFIADVIKSIYLDFKRPSSLESMVLIKQAPQWTKEQAENWSKEKYREKYLGIAQFGIMPETEQLVGVAETELGNEIEKKVKEEKPSAAPSRPAAIAVNPSHDLIKSAKINNQFISFTYEGKPTIVKPLQLNGSVLTAHCYVKNTDRSFNLHSIQNPTTKDKAFTVEAKGPNIGIERIKEIVNTAIRYKKYIRMRYTRRAWPELDVDKDTGEIVFVGLRESEESLRTINNIGLSIDVLGQEEILRYNFNDEYITSYCNLRNEQRTFKFDRISEIALLNI